jgi:hypothetical protein
MTQEKPIRPDRPAQIPFDHAPQASPIVENADLPAMGATSTVSPGLAAGEGAVLMPQIPVADPGGPGRMSPLSALTKSRPFLEGNLGKLIGQVIPSGRAAFPDQQKPAGVVQQKPAAEGYVRLRVRYENGVLRVLNAKQVEGPLVQSAQVGSGVVYEVTSNGRRVSLEWLPDTGVSRAFANIDRPEAYLGHEGTVLGAFEFIARVPLAELAPQALPKVQIALHRVVTPPETPLSAEPLATQLGAAVVEMARLPSLDIATLEPGARADLSQILKLP